MKIALIGYGRMGKEIEKIALERNHQIILTIDSAEDWEKRYAKLTDADIAIEFAPEQAGDTATMYSAEIFIFRAA